MNEPPVKRRLSQHPVLPAHYGAEEDRVGYIRGLFDRTAESYDRINVWMSLNRGEHYRRGRSPGRDDNDSAT